MCQLEYLHDERSKRLLGYGQLFFTINLKNHLVHRGPACILQSDIVDRYLLIARGFTTLLSVGWLVLKKFLRRGAPRTVVDYRSIFRLLYRVFLVAVETNTQGVLDGFNATVFAYGCTGAGKTYTMIGNDQEGHEGIMVLTLQDLFKQQYRVSVSEVQRCVVCFDVGKYSRSCIRISFLIFMVIFLFS